MKGRGIGYVADARADLLDVRLPAAALGDAVQICVGRRRIVGTVRRVNGETASVAAHESLDGVRVGCAVELLSALCAPLGMRALGRAIDARGRPIDGAAAIGAPSHGLELRAPEPKERLRPSTPLWTGIKAIDALITIARGSRVGIFGAAGAGKSTLLTMLSQASAADAIVVGLVGERGREASDWCAHRNPRMTVVCAASDRSAAERIAAAQTAMAQAACLRTLGLHVLVIIDSLARLGAALREVAVGCGEPLGRGGLPASVFADLAGFVEVAGVTDTGSITLAATVLSEGPQERDPLSEAARSLLDGHIVLSRDMAQEGRYPAVDVPSSASRLMNGVVTAEHARAALVVRRAICALNESRDARSLGLPQVDPWVMAAQQYEGAIDFLLRQGAQSVGSPETVGILCEVAHQIQSAAG